MDPILSQMNPVNIFPFYASTTHLNFILPSMPRSSEWSLSFVFSDKNFVCIPLFSHGSYIPRVSLLHDLITLKILAKGKINEALHYAVFSGLLPLPFSLSQVEIFSQHLLSNTLTPSSLKRRTRSLTKSKR
jgi:hypothetical protein